MLYEVITTEDEYGVVVRSILQDRGIDLSAITRVIVSSVVPQLTAAMTKMSRHLFGVEPVLVGPAVYDRLPVNVVAANEIGSDLVADAVAAWSRFGGACLVVDFGTALTFTAIDSSGSVITSYSIHYTKLYDPRPSITRMSPASSSPIAAWAAALSPTMPVTVRACPHTVIPGARGEMRAAMT